MSIIAILSLLLIGSIIWMIKNPVKGFVTKKQPQLKRPEPPKPERRLGLAIKGIAIRYGHTTIQFVQFTCPEIIPFPKLESGQPAETTYLLIDQSQNVLAFSSEEYAQQAFVQRDYGIVAITLDRNRIIQRTLNPINGNGAQVPAIEFDFS